MNNVLTNKLIKMGVDPEDAARIIEQYLRTGILTKDVIRK